MGQKYTARYLSSDGLPSQEIYDLHQDKNGLIWIACDRGIASFNGSYFNSYSIIDGLPSNMVFEFFEQPDGTIWCTTKENELFYFHPDTLVFHHYKYNYKLKDLHKSLGAKCESRALVVGKDGSVKFRFLWRPGAVSVSAKGILSYDLENWENSKHTSYYGIRRDKTGYPYNYLTDKKVISQNFGRGKRHHLWEVDDHFIRITEEGYQILNARTLKLIKHCPSAADRAIVNSGTWESGFWIGISHSGLKLIDGNGELKNHLAKEFSCTSYLKDSDGGIWVGTHGSGLLYYSNAELKVIPSSAHKQIHTMSIDDKGNLLFLTNEDLVSKVDEKLNIVSTKAKFWNRPLSQYYFFNDSLFDGLPADESIHGIMSRYSDNRYQPPLFIYKNALLSSKYEVLMNTRREVNRIVDAEYFGDEIVVAVGQSLYLIDKNGKKLRVKNLGVNLNEIDVCGGKVYCATKGKGLIILNKNFKILNRINSSNGASSNYVFEILCKKDVIWLGTSMGLSKAYIQRNGVWKIENLTMHEGLADHEVRDIEIIYGKVFLATREGVCYFEEPNWKSIINEETKVHFKKMKLLVKGLPRKNLIDLSHVENQIEIDFELITFSNSRNLNFRYKLLGFNNEWKYTSERKVVYHSLPPGDYEIVIQPVINGSPRSVFIKEKIIIHEAFYKEWWFVLSIFGFFILIIWLFFKYRILNYNRDVIREILRQIMKRLRPKTNMFIVRSNGKDIKVKSEEVLYVESSRNYITIYTEGTKYVIREKISNFMHLVPDPLEYARIKRSIIVRVDKITSKSVDSITIGGEEIKAGSKYLDNFRMIEL